MSFDFNRYDFKRLSEFVLSHTIKDKNNEIDVIDLLTLTVYDYDKNWTYVVSPEKFTDWLVSERICKRDKDVVIVEDMDKLYATFLKPNELRRFKIEQQYRSQYRLTYDMLFELTLKIKNNATCKRYPPYDLSAVAMLALGEETDEMLDELITNCNQYIKQAKERIDLAFKYYRELYSAEDKRRIRYNIHCWQCDIKRYEEEIQYLKDLKTDDD